MLARKPGTAAIQRALQRIALGGGLAQAPAGGHVHMQVEIAALAGAAAGDVVEADVLGLGEAVQHLLHLLQRLSDPGPGPSGRGWTSRPGARLRAGC